MTMPEEPESESVKKEKSGVLTVAVVVLLVLLPLIYLFAVGPIVWLSTNGYLSENAKYIINVVYEPLGYLLDKVPLFNSIYQWWVELWQ
jgi:hypothetical protein